MAVRARPGRPAPGFLRFRPARQDTRAHSLGHVLLGFVASSGGGLRSGYCQTGMEFCTRDQNPRNVKRPPATASRSPSASSSERTGGRTKWNCLSVFSTTLTAMPSGTSMPSAFRAAAGLAISSALKAGSRQAFAMILPNTVSFSDHGASYMRFMERCGRGLAPLPPPRGHPRIAHR